LYTSDVRIDHYSGDKIKKNETGRACSTYGERRGPYRFWWRNQDVTDQLEDPGVDGRIVLRWILSEWNGGMDWIDLIQDRDRWRALVNAVMNLRVP
jgi:hypothetical protein